MIRLFLADEQPVVLAGLRSFFVGTEFKIVGESSDASKLQSEIERLTPQIVLLDSTQPSFVPLVDSIRKKFKVVDFPPSLKTASKQTLLDLLRSIAPKRVVARGKRVLPEKSSQLTPRELDVLGLIVQGLSNKEIARTLGISFETVKEHVQNILRKTSLADRTQLALWAVRQEIASL